MSPLLLRDEGLMRVVGFNAHQIANGVTRRGDSKRQAGVVSEHRRCSHRPVSSNARDTALQYLSLWST